MKMLLKRENVALDTVDNEGRTPLSLAAERGYTRIVEIFENGAALAKIS